MARSGVPRRKEMMYLTLTQKLDEQFLIETRQS